MAGNLMEWCQDWYSRDAYTTSPRKNPKGPPAGAYRVVRRRIVLRRFIRPSLVWPIGSVAVVPGASDDRLPGGPGTLATAKTVDVAGRAHDEHVPRDGRSRHDHLPDLVLAEQLKLRTGLHDVH